MGACFPVLYPNGPLDYRHSCEPVHGEPHWNCLRAVAALPVLRLVLPFTAFPSVEHPIQATDQVCALITAR